MTELVIALDYSKKEDAEAMIQKLDGLPVIFKVGLELFLSAGPQWVKEVASKEHRIFLDLKFHDIPQTVARSVLQATRLGVEFMTVHLSGGTLMLDAIEKAFRDAELSGEVMKRPRVLGVSVLTSFKKEDWIASISHVAKLSAIRPIDEAVVRYSNLAHDHPALGGMVCSPQELKLVRPKYADLYLMIPGIRMDPESESEFNDDQGRVMSPDQASRLGASAIVVGRPITQATDPRAVVENILGNLV